MTLGSYRDTFELDFRDAMVVPRIWYFYPPGHVRAKDKPFQLGAWSMSSVDWDIDTEMEAKCQYTSLSSKSSHGEAPSQSCSCGYYAWRLLPDNYISQIVNGVRAVAEQAANGLTPKHNFLTMGQAFFWGTVHEHELGWRVGRVKFRSLFAAPTNPEVIQVMQDITNVKLNLDQILAYNDFMYRIAGGLVPIEELHFYRNETESGARRR